MSGRKYGQRGYMDSDDDRRRQGPRRPKRERRPGPRGRGLGKPTATVFRCAPCGEKQLDGADYLSPISGTGVSLDAECWKCGADLHTCTNCRHFDTSVPGECRAGAPEYVASKARRTTCDLFEPKATQEFAENLGGDTPSDAKTAFDALFKL